MNTNNMSATKKMSKKSSSSSVKVEEPKVEEPKVEEQLVEEPKVEEPKVELSVEEQIKSLMSVVETQMKQLKNVKNDIKSLLTVYQKEVKENKNKKKKRVKNENKEYTPHGFTKPVHISAELASFLNSDKDTMIARPSVTRAISIYVKENSLFEPSNKSIFKADKVLKKVLGEPQFLVEPRKPELGLGYSYKNLQKYLSPHFRKA